MSAAHILVVDDEPDIRNLVREILQDEGYEVSVAEGGTAARAARREQHSDLVLLDIWMPDVDGITLLKEWSEGDGLTCPVIIMSGHGTVESAVEATRLGAYDYIEKPLSLTKLLLTVEGALKTDKYAHDAAVARRRLHANIEPIGKSPQLTQLREQARRIAAHDTWALISGEAGSGKRTFARYMHGSSARRDAPFVEFAASSIAPERVAWELFGGEDGDKLYPGCLEQAHGGVLFLDEVADIDLATQARLLHAVQGRGFVRVNGSNTQHVNVRVIAATHHYLEQAVRSGRFREDLYYHLNVVSLRIPPLREHCADVPDLLNHYISVFVDQQGLPYRRFTVAAQNRLRNHAWPGNVRELKNLVQRLLILGAGSEIALDEVEAALDAPAPSSRADVTVPVAVDQPLREAREQFERAYLQYQLQACGSSIGRLAKLTGMERTHLYRKLRALGIDLKRSGD